MIIRIVKLGLPAAIVAGGLFLADTASFAKPAYAKTEKKACIVCHVAQGKKDLNEVGKCYGANNHSLATCDAKK